MTVAGVQLFASESSFMCRPTPVDGPISVAEIGQQVRHEDVETIILLSDDPSRRPKNPARRHPVRQNA